MNFIKMQYHKCSIFLFWLLLDLNKFERAKVEATNQLKKSKAIKSGNLLKIKSVSKPKSMWAPIHVRKKINLFNQTQLITKKWDTN